MTTLVIHETGTRIDIEQQPFIGDLRLLRKHLNLGWADVVDQVAKLKLNGSNYVELLDQPGFPEALAGWVWMLRLRAGERDLTPDRAMQLPIDGFHFERDLSDDRADAGSDAPADGEPAQAPTPAPTDSVRGDAEPEAPTVEEIAPTDPSTTTPTTPSAPA